MQIRLHMDGPAQGKNGSKPTHCFKMRTWGHRVAEDIGFMYQKEEELHTSELYCLKVGEGTLYSPTTPSGALYMLSRFEAVSR